MRLYSWLGTVLADAGATQTAGEMYSKWVTENSSAECGQLAAELDSLLDDCVRAASTGESRQEIGSLLNELSQIYTQALQHELDFFEQQPTGLDFHAGGLPSHALLEAARIIPPRVLIIAGSDSGGGAGIQADIKSCAAHGAFSTTAVTALTAQNSHGVQGIFPVPLDFVREQIRSVLGDIGTDVVKTGMLATSETVAAVVAGLREERNKVERWRRLLVVDPVMVSTSGHALLQAGVGAFLETLKSELFPLATIITPNLPEASLLLGGRVIDSVAAMEQAARDLCAMGPRWVLVKGGHLDTGAQTRSAEATDVLCDRETGLCQHFESSFIVTSHTHGTGCTLASSIAALLARGMDMAEAVGRAKEYVSGAIAASTDVALGSGAQGPMNHSWMHAEW
ncbi:unnamed protein product [Polarella glacialis]|uniref:Pyridoxamine kinase/Phosphomethylpyrimidine kinase domain-containing protein n=1 Tax=Polarella glacialis TaxID=89957 RepID=A0A813D327_POLGL|nr:unnamed protein product [Polarella glacialis]